MSGLVFLNLSRNHISGHIPESISKLEQLSSLDLSSNKFSDAIPRSLASLSFLGFLNLSNNNFSGRIPYTHHMSTFDAPSFAGNIGLCGIPLDNHLYDPENWLSSWKGRSNCCQWREIRFENTTGAVIAVEFNLHNPHDSSGRYEFLSLSGEIRPSLVVFINWNNLSGDLPIEMTNLLGLVVLNLSRNRFTGHIPKSISKLKQLSSLDLSSNRFSGAIPQSLGSLSFLGYLNLSNNELSGPIPDNDHMLTFNASSFAGNVGLCVVHLRWNSSPVFDNGDEKNLGVQPTLMLLIKLWIEYYICG
ncbi:hypothetical protein FEM48_Zijuj05G0019000 [Ziziphus jujuba var. spinosa]|uniref:Leucine-rich repeat-containing N-terminal plant-type domain-containing protein n=1 Tax=Ziziphus jujuba var. spinosa TaxID=714518 RepID=A0A978VC47_ZIZJJ|nr:hypothetical protein FEM48_Zijuj05G0019000 [Ziziphus jujuba var. spinosa]